MTGELLFSPTVLYFGTALALALGALVFFSRAALASGHRRSILVLGTLPTVFMAVTYVMMGLELLTVTVTGTGGREQSVVRFFAYTGVLAIVVYVLRDLVHLSQKQFVMLLIPFVALPWFALASWVTTGVAESLMSGGAFLSYLVGASLLYGPLARTASRASGERRLLYVKVTHLAVLCWGGLILTSALSEQAAGILDFFVGQLVASYIDLVFMLVFAALVYNNRELFSDEDEPGPAEDTAD